MRPRDRCPHRVVPAACSMPPRSTTARRASTRSDAPSRGWRLGVRAGSPGPGRWAATPHDPRAAHHGVLAAPRRKHHMGRHLFNPVTTRRRLTKRAGAAALGGVAALATAGAFVASAAVPTFPDNIVVFPDRDFVTVEGYQDHLGETATAQGHAAAARSSAARRPIVAEGDAAFEINHPGGACWGAGTGPEGHARHPARRHRVDLVRRRRSRATRPCRTPTSTGVNYLDRPDHVHRRRPRRRRRQPRRRWSSASSTPSSPTRRSPAATSAPCPAGSRRRAEGRLLVRTSSSAATTFTATYVFDDPEVARIAATGGGERIMSWQEEDADANRQGLTIAEFGELGGPGMGGCPAGPSEQSAPRARHGRASCARPTSGPSASSGRPPRRRRARRR